MGGAGAPPKVLVPGEMSPLSLLPAELSPAAHVFQSSASSSLSFEVKPAVITSSRYAPWTRHPPRKHGCPRGHAAQLVREMCLPYLVSLRQVQQPQGLPGHHPST